ncbi:MAG: InlB B-repeat-containing protein [Oscillospiraceae bacterium]|nr:InlB B-repeat-containing protein [Oscillospiraceae bacterium]
MYKRMIAWLLLFAMSLSLLPTALAAEEEPSSRDVAVEAETCSIEGESSLGAILSGALNEYSTDPGNEAYAVTDLETNGKVVYADVNAQTDCTLAVSVLDEETGELLATQTKAISAGEGRVSLTLDETLPRHYVTRAVLLDTANGITGQVYTDNDHTLWYEEYLNTGVEDFDGANIVQLEESTEDNFAVLLDSVVVLEDEALLRQGAENTYIFACNQQTEALAVGDVFAYDIDNTRELLIGKVRSVSQRSDALVVTVDEAELDEAFSFVKIHCEVEHAFADTPEKRDSISGDKEYSKTWSFNKGAFSGNVTLSASFSFSLEYSLWNRYAKASLSISPKGSIHAEVNWASGRQVISVAKPTVMVYGVSFTFDVKLVFQASAKVTFDAEISAKFGFSWDTKNGKKNTSKKPTITSSIKIEGHIYLGLQLIPSVSLLKVAKLSLTGEAGAQLNASAEASYVTGQTEKHDCGLACIAGDVDGTLKVSATLKVSICGWEAVNKTWKLIDKNYQDILVFHYSIKYGEFGFGQCQHMAYLLTIKVVDEDGKAVKATVDGNSTGKGVVKLWYTNETHTLKIRASGYKSQNYSIGVDSPQEITIIMEKGNSNEVSSKTDPSYTNYNRNKGSKSSGYGGYSAPLSYVEPGEGVRLSTACGSTRRNDVAWVQRELKKLGYSCPVDGYFGSSTKTAVCSFQGDYSLPVNGIVDANVVAVIKQPLKMVGIPRLRLLSPANMPADGIASVGWDAVEHAECYEVEVYDDAGKVVYAVTDSKATTASLPLYTPGSYTVKVRAKNARFTGEPAVLDKAFTVLSKSTVVFIDWDGTLLSKQFVEYGQGAVTPAAPERDGHTFYKWDKDYSKVTEDLTVTALYNKNRYKVTFLNSSGKEIRTDKCTFGEAAVAPELGQLAIPTGCEFVGWDKDFSCVTEDLVVRPVVRYINEDLPITIEECTVVENGDYGYTVTAVVRNYDKQRTTGRVVVALKTHSEQFLTMTESSAFTLGKSDFNSDHISRTTLEIFVPCKQSVSYVDVFAVAAYDDLIPISETERHTLQTPQEGVSTRQLEGKLDPSLAGKQAILFIYKIGDASDYTNEFIGQTVIGQDGSYSFRYNLREEPSVKTGDFTVVLGVEGAENAIYLDKIQAPKPVYTVTIQDFDATVLSRQQVVQGENAVLPEENPEREGYIFAGWDYTNSAIYEDQTITAIYVPKTYTVVFIDWTNHRFDVDTYTHGETLIAPDLSSPEEYNTIGWNVTEGTKVTQNMVITARYEKKTFTVQFYDYEGNVFDEQVVEYGDDAQIPSLTENSTHIFYDWDTEELSSVKRSLQVHPLYAYTEDAAAPVANVREGIYSDPVTLSFSCEEGGRVYYAIDDGAFVQYTSPITIEKTASLSYYATVEGKNDSPCVTGCYIINRPGEEALWQYPVHVYDGQERIAVYVRQAGSLLTPQTLPVLRKGYVLEGYYTDQALTQKAEDGLQGETTVYAKLMPEEYEVVFRDVNGKLLSTQSVPYLQAAQEPETEVIEVPESYVFAGWDTDAFYCVTEDVAVTTRIVKPEQFAAIRLDREFYTMMEGYSHSLSATITGAEGYDVHWSSSDTTVAAVNDSGRITALRDGVVVIMASVPALGLCAPCYVNVLENPDQSIALPENSTYTKDSDYIYGIRPGENCVQTVLDGLASVGVVFYQGEQELGMEDRVCTGTVVRLYDRDGSLLDEKILVVRGDVDGDGLAGVADASHITRALLGKELLEGAYAMAADANADGAMNNRDASLILRYLVNKDSI